MARHEELMVAAGVRYTTTRCITLHCATPYSPRRAGRVVLCSASQCNAFLQSGLQLSGGRVRVVPGPDHTRDGVAVSRSPPQLNAPRGGPGLAGGQAKYPSSKLRTSITPTISRLLTNSQNPNTNESLEGPFRIGRGGKSLRQSRQRRRPAPELCRRSIVAPHPL